MKLELSRVGLNVKGMSEKIKQFLNENNSNKNIEEEAKCYVFSPFNKKAIIAIVAYPSYLMKFHSILNLLTTWKIILVCGSLSKETE